MSSDARIIAQMFSYEEKPTICNPPHITNGTLNTAERVSRGTWPAGREDES